MTEEIESRLRQHLATVDRIPVAGSDLVADSAELAGRRMQRRRRLTAAAVSGGLVVVVGSALWMNRGGEHDPAADVAGSPATTEPLTTSTVGAMAGSTVATVGSSGSTGAPSPPSAWSPIAPDPRGPATRPSVVWTGAEAIVVGGLDRAGEPVAGAAAYDPVTDTWRTLADPPSTQRINPLVVWTGEEVLVIGGDNPDGSVLVSYGTAYDPAADTWRYTATPHVGFVTDRSPAAWTGSELLVWPWDGSPGGGSTMEITPIAYDPAADAWRELPEPPVERRQQAGSVWTGSEWIVWGGTAGDRELADGAAFDPATNTWRTIAASPLSARRVRAVWTGSEMIVDAGSRGGAPISGDGELALADGAAYDPATDSWRAITSGLAHPGFLPVWTGDHLVMFAKGGAAVYDVAADRWVDTCCSETGDGGAGTPVWTGTAVLLAGSYDTGSGGALFEPPDIDG